MPYFENLSSYFFMHPLFRYLMERGYDPDLMDLTASDSLMQLERQVKNACSRFYYRHERRIPYKSSIALFTSFVEDYTPTEEATHFERSLLPFLETFTGGPCPVERNRRLKPAYVSKMWLNDLASYFDNSNHKYFLEAFSHYVDSDVQLYKGANSIEISRYVNVGFAHVPTLWYSCFNNKYYYSTISDMCSRSSRLCRAYTYKKLVLQP